MFNGKVITAEYQTATQCEYALMEATDLGKLKSFKVAQCIDLNQTRDKYEKPSR